MFYKFKYEQKLLAIKSEPSTWSWQDQVKSKIDMWDGVRNYNEKQFNENEKRDQCFIILLTRKCVGIVK